MSQESLTGSATEVDVSPGNGKATAGPSFKDRRWVGILLALPAFLLLLAVIVVPEAWALVLSFSRLDSSGMTFVGLENYAAILSDPAFWNAVKNTVAFVVGSVALQLVFGTSVALLLGQGFPGQNIWVAIVLAPSAMSPAILGTTWRYLLNVDIGPLNFTLRTFGLPEPAWLSDVNVAIFAILIVYVWNTLPQTFIFVYPALISIPQEYFEAARMDGASSIQVLRHVTLPLLYPALLIALIFRTIISVRAFGEVFVLTQGGPFRSTELVSIYLYKEGFVYFSWGTAAAVGWILLILTMVLAAPQVRAISRQMFGTVR